MLSAAGELWRGRVALLIVAAGTAITFVLGPTLQVLALRQLDAGGYAVFVLALAVGNIAGAFAGVVQPVVAAGVLDGHAPRIPAKGNVLAFAGLAAVAGGALALAPVIGWWLALIVVLQLPLHFTLGAMLGILQGRRQFGRFSLGATMFAPARLLFAGALAAAGVATGATFAGALTFALALSLVFVGFLGGRDVLATRPGAPPAGTATGLAGWAALAVLLNADVLLSRAMFGDADAGRYALAFSLGRVAYMASVGLAAVWLPLAWRNPAARAQTLVATATAALLGAGLFAAVGIAPDAVVEILTGDTSSGYAGLVRAHVFAGTIAALLNLLVVLAFARGAPPRASLAIAGLVPAVVMAITDGSPAALAWANAAGMSLVTAALLVSGLRPSASEAREERRGRTATRGS
jgi:hypothetical protein